MRLWGWSPHDCITVFIRRGTEQSVLSLSLPSEDTARSCGNSQAKMKGLTKIRLCWPCLQTEKKACCLSHPIIGTVVPQYLLGIGSRNCHGFQNERMLKSHSLPSIHICRFCSHIFNQLSICKHSIWSRVGWISESGTHRFWGLTIMLWQLELKHLCFLILEGSHKLLIKFRYNLLIRLFKKWFYFVNIREICYELNFASHLPPPNSHVENPTLMSLYFETGSFKG